MRQSWQSTSQKNSSLNSWERFNNELGSFGGRLELLRRRRKAGNPELHPLHPLLRPERRLVLDLHKGPLVSTLPDLVSTHCPKTAQKVFWEGPLVSTLLDLVSTHYPKTAQKVFWEGSDEEPVESDGTEQE
ncbi:hypothetical protein Taro_015728 [Colocasia esculenta]|uniref:Uncharacterized protein n=1 Tax=Colocasia esculenta TaxID=4460 RepID=A0A843UID3_COLES|nr:hypothetical protein [Colocasia esculenta]